MTHALLDVVQRLFAVHAVRYRSELASAVLLAACSPASAVALLGCDGSRATGGWWSLAWFLTCAQPVLAIAAQRLEHSIGTLARR